VKPSRGFDRYLDKKLLLRNARPLPSLRLATSRQKRHYSPVARCSKRLNAPARLFLFH
jgi:hypothetical protein